MLIIKKKIAVEDGEAVTPRNRKKKLRQLNSGYQRQA
jgi:hypothetical protein